MIDDIIENLEAFSTRRLKRCFKKYIIWYDVNKNFMEDELGNVIGFWGQEIGFDNIQELKYKMINVRSLDENMSLWPYLGPKLLEIFS